MQRAPQDRLIDLLSKLISIESVNPVFGPGGHGESAVADFIEQHCRRAGLHVTRQPVLPDRENLLVELAVPGAESTILFESHMDTVSLAPMDERALRPEIREGRLFGRGACDDKGSLAAMIAAFETLAGRRKELKANLLLLCAVDEEHQFRGVLDFVDRKIPVDGAVVGEPTDLRVVIAHKGVVRWRLSTLGRAAHSSEPHEGNSAIDQMADVLLALRRLQTDLEGRRHPLVGPPTLNVGRITGGIGVNIVPDRCTIELERRIVGDENHATALAEIDSRLAEQSAANPQLQIEREEPFVTTPTLATPPDSAIVIAAQKACRDVGVSDALAGVSYGSDASKLWTFGKIPSVVLGPGSIRQAHTADEFVPLDELSNAAKIYVQIALNWPGGYAAERSSRETGGI